MNQEKLTYLIKLIAENDDQLAFNKLYRHYHPGLLAFITSILRDRHHSEEILLDIFSKLWGNRKTLSKISNLSSYLYISAKYASISFLRKQNRIFYDELSDSSHYSFSDPEQALILKEELELLNQAIRTLPPKCRLIFQLVKEERLKYKEVAELLGVSQKTVESQIFIATKKLLEVMRKPSAARLKNIK